MTDWNGFVGKAKRIEDVDLPRIGHEIGVGEDVIHAILDVESRGRGFDARGRPVMLFEPHVFYRQLKRDPAKQAAAVSAGLAYPKWRRDYPADSYSRLYPAIEIDETAALMSASWGLGQVMGFNFAAAGFGSVQEMVRAMMDDEDNHLEAMIAFIVRSGLDDELRALEAATTREGRIAAARDFARGYNGSGYAVNRYHTRIVDRYEWWRGKPDTPWSPDDAESEDKVAELDAGVGETVADDVAGLTDPPLLDEAFRHAEGAVDDEPAAPGPILPDVAPPSPPQERKIRHGLPGFTAYAIAVGLIAAAVVFYSLVKG